MSRSTEEDRGHWGPRSKMLSEDGTDSHRKTPEKQKRDWAEKIFSLQPLSEVDSAPLPTHLRAFSSAEQYQLVKETHQQLLHSGYYWGALSMEQAHAMLSPAPPGSFLIRDSIQPDVFFTLSYSDGDGPTSVRVMLNKDLQFSLCGSHKSFASFFALLSHYTGPSSKLRTPHRKQRPEQLTHMCRRALVRVYGADCISAVSGLSNKDKQMVPMFAESTVGVQDPD